MQATVGDRLHVRGSVVGQPERPGEIVGAEHLASRFMARKQD
jgi:hypothetical protein